MPARLVEQLAQRRAQPWGLLAREDLLDPAAVALQQLLRHEQLTPRGIPRQCRYHLRHALGQSGVTREMLDLFGRARSDPRPQ